MTITVSEPWRPMKWWGWGDPARLPELPEPAVELLKSGLGVEGSRAQPPRLDAVRTDVARLNERVRRELADLVGADAVRDDHGSRVAHAAGKGYPDLLRMRNGDARGAPDAVVYPASAFEVWKLLELCARYELAAVPFGGGTSVVGGVEPVRGRFEAVISIDLARMIEVAEIDDRSLLARLGPGLRGPQAESVLAPHGLTLGQFPQSFEYATVGGWVATRSAGQASTGYGRVDDLVAGLRCVTPTGEVVLPARPASATGPDVTELFVGSEGIFGIITEASLRVSRAPELRHYEGWTFPDFSTGADALRKLAQNGDLIEVARLSDEAESGIFGALAGTQQPGCTTIVGLEGTTEDVARRRIAVEGLLRGSGGLPLGPEPGRVWDKGRYEGPYLRDTLLDYGVLVETLETATRWSNLEPLYAAVGAAISNALAARGTPAIVMCHISHLYSDGASLYFTFLARQQAGQELHQWQAAKSAATDAIVAAGGTLSHHHAIGRDHAPWLAREIGSGAVESLRAVKRTLDPLGIMNPGKLLPEPGGAAP